MNPALQDEITSINSIYDDTTLMLASNASTPTAATICTLRLPALPSVSLRLAFPPDYPDAPPSVLGTQTVGDDAPKGFGTRVVDVVRHVLATVYRPGEPCVFDLVEDVGETLQREQSEPWQPQSDGGAAGEQEAGTLSTLPPTAAGLDWEKPEREFEPARSRPSLAPQLDGDDADDVDSAPPPWLLGEPVTEKKSVFLARVAPVADAAQAKRYVRHLLATDKKAARASHNITAWRIRGANDAVFQDCDDDGESAAGGRVLHLMQLMDVWDVMVVVTRWYGGVRLGPDRFRIINQAAREALVLGGFVKEPKESGKKKGKK